MKVKAIILFLTLLLPVRPIVLLAQPDSPVITFDFCGQPIQFTFNKALVPDGAITY
jgi:hypothetical protein